MIEQELDSSMPRYIFWLNGMIVVELPEETTMGDEVFVIERGSEMYMEYYSQRMEMACTH